MADKDTIRYGNQDYPILDHIRVGNCTYAVLQKIGSAARRYWVCQQSRGQRHVFRQILILPSDQTSRQHLAVLQRISQGNPNLPLILECRRRGAEFYVVTTWIHGDNLRDFLRCTQNGRNPRKWPSPCQMMELYRGLTHGLTQLHRHCRVVHGDIKPENLIFAHAPNRLVTIDFGSAWTMEKTMARYAGDGTSEYYAAPEQQGESRRADFRTDQFSATVVAYEMLTGKRPYGGMGGKAGLPELKSQYEPMYQPPSAFCPLKHTIPRRIWAIVDEALERGLALNPDDRFQNRTDWIEAVEDIHCELRRKVRFTAWEKFCTSILDRILSRKRPT